MGGLIPFRALCGCGSAAAVTRQLHRGRRGKTAIRQKVCVPCLDIVLIKTHSYPKIRFFVVGRRCRVRGTDTLSAVRSRVVPLWPLPTQEAGDVVRAAANGRPAAEPAASDSSARTRIGPLGGLALRPEGDAAAAAAHVGPAVVHEPTHTPVRTWVGPPRSLTEPGDPAREPNTLESVHAPTAKVIQQLRRARQTLQRAASPELRLSPAIRALWRTEVRLARPLRVAVCGEINSGKSSLANLLAGIESLPTAMLSNTRIPTLLSYAAEPEIWTVQPNGKRARLLGEQGMSREAIFRIEVGLPSTRLQAMQIIDLPGVVDPRSGLPEIDLIAHHVDVAIWCTMSTQAWKESERTAWSLLPARLGNRGLLVATHRDLLRDPRDQEKLLGRLHHDVGASFAGIVLVSTAEALAVMGKEAAGPAGAGWVASGAAELEAVLGGLLLQLREQRAAAALRMTGRVAYRALARLDDEMSSGLGCPPPA